MSAPTPHPLPPAPRPAVFPRPSRADFARLVRLAVPVVTVQVGLMAMGVVDVIMVGHYSAADLAATALGNIFVYGIAGFSMGALMALDPLVSQAVGAGDQPAVARTVQRGMVIAALLSLPTMALLLVIGPLLPWLGQPAEIVPLATAYLSISAPGVPAFLAFVVLRQSLQAMGRLRPVVWTIVIANLINVGLTWVLVFGKFGVPTHGSFGAGLATLIARFLLALMLLALSWKVFRPLFVPRRRQAFALQPLLRTMRIGLPIGGQIVLETGAFAIIALLMGRLGTVPMAAHQVAINIASLAFMVPLGVSSAVSVLVGHGVGAGDAARSRRAASAGLVTGAGFMLVSAALFIGAPGLLARVYSSDLAVVAMAAALIPIAGVFQVFDGLQVVAIGILRGVGDTRAPMVINVLGFWLLGFPASLGLGFGLGLGPEGLWWGLVVGLAVVALLLLARVRARMGRELKRLVVDEDLAPVSG
jgi:MATE family multidrug resistance protein